MQQLKNHVIKEPGTIKKNKRRKEQLQNIISLRINDDEKNMLEKLTKTTSKSISEIMREAIELWSSKRRRAYTD